MSDDEIQEILNLHHHLQIFKQREGSLRRIKETFKLWVNCFLWVQGHLFVYVYYCLSSVLRIVPDKLCIQADPGNEYTVCLHLQALLHTMWKHMLSVHQKVPTHVLISAIFTFINISKFLFSIFHN